MIAKMRNDAMAYSLNKNHAHKIKAFDANSVRWGELHNMFDGWHGWRVEFEWGQSWQRNLILNNDDWLKDTRAEI